MDAGLNVGDEHAAGVMALQLDHGAQTAIAKAALGPSATLYLLVSALCFGWWGPVIRLLAVVALALEMMSCKIDTAA